METPHPPDDKKLRDASKEVRQMGVLLLLLGLIALAMGVVAWQRTTASPNTSHYLLIAAFGIVLCGAGIYTYKNGNRKE